ncbi:TPA: hypothetical protein ACH3X2_011141 [Trebouxia sp. C0005]
MRNQGSAGAALVVRDYDPTQSSRSTNGFSTNPAGSHQPSRRSFRLNPQTTAEAAASEKPSELALFIVTGTCPRCGKVKCFSAVLTLCKPNANLHMSKTDLLDVCQHLRSCQPLGKSTARPSFQPHTAYSNHSMHYAILVCSL